jgi:hypothetical protein
MAMFTSLDAVPLWGIFLLAMASIMLALEVGHRLGSWRRRRADSEKDAPVGGMVAAELGLLALLLAFTFGIAASRFDDRRRVLLDETNAIDTTYLRAAMLPDPHKTEIRRLLSEYVEVRIAGAQQQHILDKIQRSEELHRLLWAEAVAAAAKDPRSVPTGLFIESLNEVIDLHSKRVQAGIRTRVPPTIWAVLLIISVLSFVSMGYQNGLCGTSRSPASLVVALAFASVIWLVMDLERPHQGSLRVSQQPLIELQRTMGTH